MINTQQIAIRIKSVAKTKNISVKQLLENCGLNINTISELSKGKQISYLNFARIADYLDVSVDYLLGRTDTPNIVSGIKIGDNSINNNGNVNISTASNSEIAEFAEMMNGLSLVQRSKVVVMIDEMKKGE